MCARARARAFFLPVRLWMNLFTSAFVSEMYVCCLFVCLFPLKTHTVDLRGLSCCDDGWEVNSACVRSVGESCTGDGSPVLLPELQDFCLDDMLRPVGYSRAFEAVVLETV